MKSFWWRVLLSKINSFINELEAQRLIQNHKYGQALPLLLDALRMGQFLSKETLLQNIALCYIKTQEYQQSLSYLFQVIEENPRNTAAQYNLAYAQYMLGQHDKALDRFSLIELQEGLSTDVTYYLTMTSILTGATQRGIHYLDSLSQHEQASELLYNIGIELIQKGSPAGARDVFIHYLESHPQDLDTTFGLGIAYIEMKEFHAAIECLSRVTAQDSRKYPSALTMLGVAQFQIGNIKEAHSCIRDSLKMDPHSFEGWYYLGIIYEHSRQPEQALQSFHRAAEIQDDSHEVWEHIGFLYFHENDYPHAQNAFKKAWQISRQAKYAYHIGLIHMVRENFRKAVEYFTLSMEGEHYQDSLENLSICYYHLKEYQKVIDLLSPLPDEKMPKAILYFILGSAYMKTGSLEFSLEKLETGHKKYPSEVNILYSLGLLKANQEDFEAATRYFENALIINRQPEILYALALARMQLSQEEDAVHSLEEYRLYCEKDAGALYKLGLLFLQLNARPQARECFTRVLDINPENSRARNYLAELEQKQ